MPGPTSLRWRMLRSGVFAAVATQLAAIGHLIGGGGFPDVAVLLIGALSIGSASVVLSTRRRGFAGILAVLLTAQIAFHLLFMVDVHGMHAGLTPPGPGPMVAFHIVAALAGAAVLAKGESALFALFGALCRALAIAVGPLVVDLPPHWTAAATSASELQQLGPLLVGIPRRGPPVSHSTRVTSSAH